MKKFMYKQPYVFWSIIFLLLGTAMFTIITAVFGFSKVGIFPITMFAILFSTSTIAVGSAHGIATNSIALANENFEKYFSVKFGDAYELYDSLQEALNKLLKLQQEQTQNPNTKTYKKLVKYKDNYNKLLLSVNNLNIKNRKAFERYCTTHQTFTTFAYVDLDMEQQLKALKTKKQNAKVMRNMLQQTKHNPAPIKAKQPTKAKQKSKARIVADKLQKEKEL